MNVVIYARFSSSGQREESIEGQVAFVNKKLSHLANKKVSQL